MRKSILDECSGERWVPPRVCADRPNHRPLTGAHPASNVCSWRYRAMPCSRPPWGRRPPRRARTTARCAKSLMGRFISVPSSCAHSGLHATARSLAHTHARRAGNAPRKPQRHATNAQTMHVPRNPGPPPPLLLPLRLPRAGGPRGDCERSSILLRLGAHSLGICRDLICVPPKKDDLSHSYS